MLPTEQAGTVIKHFCIAALIAGAAWGASTTLQGQQPKGFGCDPDNGGLTLPPGFCAGVIADDLGVARNLVVASNGDIFVSVRSGPPVQGQPPSARLHPGPARYERRRQDGHPGKVRHQRGDRHPAPQWISVLRHPYLD